MFLSLAAQLFLIFLAGAFGCARAMGWTVVCTDTREALWVTLYGHANWKDGRDSVWAGNVQTRYLEGSKMAKTLEPPL